MSKSKSIFASKYRIKPLALIVYLFFILGTMYLVLGYLFETLRVGMFTSVYKGFYSHVTNYSISLLFCLGTGLAWVQGGIPLKYTAPLLLVTIVANLLCETIMGFMNTTDPLDAVFGIAGALIGFFVLAVISKYGLVAKTTKTQGEDNGAVQ
jgi:hypothetical protein